MEILFKSVLAFESQGGDTIYSSIFFWHMELQSWCMQLPGYAALQMTGITKKTLAKEIA